MADHPRAPHIPPAPDELRAEIVGLLAVAETGAWWQTEALKTLLRAELARLPRA